MHFQQATAGSDHIEKVPNFHLVARQAQEFDLSIRPWSVILVMR